MPAPVALRPGRTTALVQRKRRKAHVASIAPGAASWLSICDREILADGAAFWAHDAEETVESMGDDLCADCYRLVLLATLLVQRGIALPRLRTAAR